MNSDHKFIFIETAAVFTLSLALMAVDVAHTVCNLGYKFSFKTAFSFCFADC